MKQSISPACCSKSWSLHRFSNQAVLLVALLAISVYRIVGSLWLSGSCRFVPSCSEYADTAIRVHGIKRGIRLTLVRLAQCRPYGRYGLDPVPERESGI